jgi:hypothetical protein
MGANESNIDEYGASLDDWRWFASISLGQVGYSRSLHLESDSIFHKFLMQLSVVFDTL